MNVPLKAFQSPWSHLADEMENQIRDERDEQIVEWTFQLMLENGQSRRIKRVCKEWLERVEAT